MDEQMSGLVAGDVVADWESDADDCCCCCFSGGVFRQKILTWRRSMAPLGVHYSPRLEQW